MLASTASSSSWFLIAQAMLRASLLALFVGPSLVSPDLANGALPLYLCRGRLARASTCWASSRVLAAPSLGDHLGARLLLVRLQASLGGGGLARRDTLADRRSRSSSAPGLDPRSSRSLALAISAWVSWRPLAPRALFGVFISAGFGGAINEMLDTRVGQLLNLGDAGGDDLGRALRRDRLVGRATPRGAPVAACWSGSRSSASSRSSSCAGSSAPTRWCGEPGALRPLRAAPARDRSSSRTSRSSTARCSASTASTSSIPPGITASSARTAPARRRS